MYELLYSGLLSMLGMGFAALEISEGFIWVVLTDLLAKFCFFAARISFNLVNRRSFILRVCVGRLFITFLCF